jgi:hypothetical protein
MSASYYYLYIEKGSSFSTSVSLSDTFGASYNLMNFSASSQIRKSYYSANSTASFTTSINTSTGAITLSLGANTTSNIAPGRYVYDLVVNDGYGNISRILEGIAEVSPNVTR